MSEINIAFGITKDWLEYTYTVMCSILSNAKKEDEYRFFIMCSSPSLEFEFEFEKISEKLSKIHSFEYIYIEMNDNDFDGVVHDIRVGISALYRLKLSSLTDIDKVIYLDSDIVVLDDISKLWDYDIDDYLLGAVEDKYSPLMCCQANLSDDDIYVNSGVLLMNLKKFRELSIENAIFQKLRETNYSDQDVLNDICRTKILYLPLKYNLMVTTDDPNSFVSRKDEYFESLKTPTILHYSIKPWILPVQYSEYWRKYRDLLAKD